MRALIWGKTYPELSSRNRETVCTGAVDLATGRPLRLYPVPLRYLEGDQQYRLYDIVEVDITRSPRDRRPESHKIDADSLRSVAHIATDASEWAERRSLIFADDGWHFDSVAALKAAQQAGTHSMGVVSISEMIDVRVAPKAADAEVKHQEKWDSITSQQDLFPKEYRALEFIPVTIRARWRCLDSKGCGCARTPHDGAVFDWGLLELGRKTQDWSKAADKLREISDLATHDFRLFMGNLFLHQKTFVIIGFWYPKRRDQRPLL